MHPRNAVTVALLAVMAVAWGIRSHRAGWKAGVPVALCGLTLLAVLLGVLL